jgi:hypothetical protein
MPWWSIRERKEYCEARVTTRYAARGRPCEEHAVPAWIIEYEWLFFFGVILAVAVADLRATRRAQRADAARRAAPGRDGDGGNSGVPSSSTNKGGFESAHGSSDRGDGPANG